MINDNALADRLNGVKSGEYPETNVIEYEKQTASIEKKVNLLTNISLQLINLSYIMLKSISFGYAASTIFATNWSFVAMLAVGFSVETILTTIYRIFTKDK